MTKLLFAASAAAILTVAGHIPAMAQSSATGMSSPMVTCRDISTMDRDMARSVVFYVSGFQAASGSMQNQAGMGSSGTTGTTGSTTMDTSSSTAADAGSGTTGTTGSSTTDTTGTSGTSGSTSADAGSGTTGTSGSDATGSTSTAGSTSDTSGAASGASGGASSAVIAQLPGFSSVDIDRVMSDCASSPDKQLSEVIGMMGGTGSTAQ
jgi:hypothetical protein